MSGMVDAPEVAQRRGTLDVPKRDRVSYWVDLICALYASLECDSPACDELFGEVEFAHVGEVDITHLKSNAPRVRHTQSHVAQDRAAYLLVLMLRQGRGLICQDGRTAVLGVNDLAVVDTSRPYELLFEHGSHDVAVLRVGRQKMLAHVANLESVSAIAIAGQYGIGRVLGSMVDGLTPGADSMVASTAFAVSDALLTVVGAALQELPGAHGSRPSNMAAFHAARVRAYIEENLRNPGLSIAYIATALKLSPDHLSRIFRDEPIAPSRLLWLRRLQGARRDLADPELNGRGVSEIAFSWGYSDAAHFSRSFKEQFGVSPREWRSVQHREHVGEASSGM